MLVKIFRKIVILYNLLRFKGANIDCGKGLLVMGRISLIVRGRLVIGDNLNIISGNMMNTLGRNIKTSIRVDENALIKIGNNVGMSCVSLWSKKKIEIGNNVKLGADVLVFDSDMHSLDYRQRRELATDAPNAKSAAIVIEDDVFIGARSIITKGVVIGAKSIVATGSVVTKSIPSGEIWGGNPAKFIKKID